MIGMDPVFFIADALFSPAEAEKITGLDRVLQRNWRRRGLLPFGGQDQQGFTPAELAAIRVMMKLRQFGVGPSSSKAIAEQAAASVIWAAVANHKEAWALDANCSADGTLREHLAGMEHELFDTLAGIKIQKMIRYCVVVDDAGNVHLVNSVDDLLEGGSREAVAIIDLWAVAASIVALAGRALKQISVPDGSEVTHAKEV